MINLQIPEYTITGAKNWETYFEINTEDIAKIKTIKDPRNPN